MYKYHQPPVLNIILDFRLILTRLFQKLVKLVFCEVGVTCYFPSTSCSTGLDIAIYEIIMNLIFL